MKVQTGRPTINGLYVVYTAGVFERFPDKTLMMWVNDEWGYPGSDQRYRMHVSGWIGPLPNPTMDELELQEVQEGNNHKQFAYAIGKEAGLYTEGPFFDLKEVLLSLGDEGEYIFKIDDQKAKPIRKWVERKGKWMRIKAKRK